MTQTPEERLERLSAIRQQIAAGTYESPGKLEVAVERLLRVIDGETVSDAERPAGLPRQPR